LYITGFGYIDFADDSEAEKSLNSLKGIVVDGREIKVDTAGPRSVNYDRTNSYNKERENKFKPRTPQENSVFIGKI
jgi:RNA recognition motif-containing protein